MPKTRLNVKKCNSPDDSSNNNNCNSCSRRGADKATKIKLAPSNVAAVDAYADADVNANVAADADVAASAS